MKSRKALLVGCLVASVIAGAARADDKSADLQRQVEELETRLKLAEQSIELLEKEADALRVENAKLRKEDSPPTAVNEADPFRVARRSNLMYPVKPPASATDWSSWSRRSLAGRSYSCAAVS